MRPLITSAWSLACSALKPTWRTTIDLSIRRSVLLHILVLLKSKYGKVDAKISYIGRRAELALYSQAFSVWEYRNPQTLSRRLHSLVMKLHLNNLAATEDAAFATERALMAEAAASRKRKSCTTNEPFALKRARHEAVDAYGPAPSSPLFFDGNRDLLQLVCSFLTASDVLYCATTCSQAAKQLPMLVTSITVTMDSLLKLSPVYRSTFFQRFPNLESFTLTGRAQAQQINFHNKKLLVVRNVLVRSMLQALSKADLPKLAAFSLDFCYSEGLNDHVTRQVAAVLASKFSRLHTLSLMGNCISDDGVMDLYDAFARPQSPRAGNSRLALLDLSQNFIGERGHVKMQELVMHFAHRDSTLIVNVINNLLTAGAPMIHNRRERHSFVKSS